MTDFALAWADFLAGRVGLDEITDWLDSKENTRGRPTTEEK